MIHIDTKVRDLLGNMGLTATEQALYFAGLSQAGLTVSELIRHTTINRATAYHALSTMKQKGFATESKESGKLIYHMTQPQELEKHLVQRQQLIESYRQELQTIAPLFPLPQKSADDTVVIEKFEGEKAVREAVDRALYCKERRWHIIAPKNNFFSQADANYVEYFMRTRRTRGILSRSLWDGAYSKTNHLTLQELFERRPHYLPEAMHNRFKTTIILFDNKALFITSTRKSTAVIISSEEITSSLLVMFNSLWLLSKKPGKTDAKE